MPILGFFKFIRKYRYDVKNMDNGDTIENIVEKGEIARYWGK